MKLNSSDLDIKSHVVWDSTWVKFKDYLSQYYFFQIINLVWYSIPYKVGTNFKGISESIRIRNIFQH